ncbi:MAG: outer membrane protein transport protein [Sulfurimonas sp.]|nr:outer membrane protein transport protein [Sulfurimonas sp.]
MKKILLASVIVSSVLMAGGYKIPELSLNSTALSSANIAHTTGADAAYYNPANMVFMKDENSLEFNLAYIGLSAVNYKGTVSAVGPYDLDSQKESFLVPSIYFVSSKVNDMRFGLSIVSPAGLSKRWEDQPAKASAEEFSLQVIEMNPSVSYLVNNNLGVAFGVRIVHSSGIIKSTGAASRDMEGDSIDFGYNLAISYKPTSEFEVGLTYRSEIDLTVEGDAKLYSGTTLAYDGAASVSVPLPAALNLAVAYTFSTDTTVEFVYERTYWSAYKELDFEYSTSIGGLAPYFDDPVAKDWADTNAFRFGVTQPLGDTTIMGGIVFDETPIPNKTVSFDLPDSNSISVSLGARHVIDDSFDLGLAVLYSMREDRKVNNDSLVGEFSSSDVLLVSIGVGYKF